MTPPDVPEPTPVSEPFWAATRRRELLLQWCPSCECLVYYPRARCPGCGTALSEWRRSTGTATVYAHATHYSSDPGAADSRYCVALVDLDDGARLLSRIVDIDPDEVRVGLSLVLAWQPLPDGRALPVFHPAPSNPKGSS